MERGPKECGGEKGRKRSVPNPFEWEHDAVGKDGPEPGGQCRHREAADFAPREKKWNGGSRGKYAVEQNGGEEGRVGKSAEDSENPRDKSRINWCKPGGWPSRLAKNFTEPAALRKGACDIPYFLLKGNSGKDVVRNFALLIPNEGDSGKKRGGSDKPDTGQEREQFAKHRQ